MKVVVKGTEVPEATTYNSLLVNHTTQLGWYPPLKWTKEDAIAEDVFEKNGEKLPIGLYVSAIEKGRELHKVTLEKTQSDICNELQTVEVLWLSTIDESNMESEDENKHTDGIKYRDLLYRYLHVVSKALIKNRSTTSESTVVPAAFHISNPAHTSSEEEAAAGILRLQAQALLHQDLNSAVHEAVIEPRDHDVLLGRSSVAVRHVGNMSWKILVTNNKPLYTSLTSRRDKTMLTRSIVEAVKNQSPPGRFLQKDPETGLWVEVEMQKAMEKTSQALRDAPALLAPAHHHMAQRARRSTRAGGVPALVGPSGRFYARSVVGTRPTQVV